MDFGIENRALQKLVLNVLKAQAVLHPCQFGTKEGVTEAGKHVLANLADGYRWTTEIDIERYFWNVSADALPDLLHIPVGVIDSVVVSRSLTITPGNFYSWVGPDGADTDDGESGPLDEAVEEGRCGIPQGSACSPLIGEMLLAPTLMALPETVRVVAYIDNILVMAKTEEELCSVVMDLGDALKKHHAGPFASKLVGISTPKQSITFLGYEFAARNSGWVARPSSKNMAIFSHNFDRDIAKLRSKGLSFDKRRKLENTLRRYVRSWTGSVSLWPKAKSFREERITDINYAVCGM